MTIDDEMIAFRTRWRISSSCRGAWSFVVKGIVDSSDKSEWSAHLLLSPSAATSFWRQRQRDVTWHQPTWRLHFIQRHTDRLLR